MLNVFLFWSASSTSELARLFSRRVACEAKRFSARAAGFLFPSSSGAGGSLFSAFSWHRLPIVFRDAYPRPVALWRRPAILAALCSEGTNELSAEENKGSLENSAKVAFLGGCAARQENNPVVPGATRMAPGRDRSKQERVQDF